MRPMPSTEGRSFPTTLSDKKGGMVDIGLIHKSTRFCFFILLVRCWLVRNWFWFQTWFVDVEKGLNPNVIWFNHRLCAAILLFNRSRACVKASKSPTENIASVVNVLTIFPSHTDLSTTLRPLYEKNLARNSDVS